MSRTALTDALRKLDLERVREILARRPELESLRVDGRWDLLQFCCGRPTAGDSDAAERQVRLARWLVDRGFDPLVIHTTAPGEDGEGEPARVSLVWFAVAKARNDALARYLLEKGADPRALYAAVWWGAAGILADLVRHGADPNELVGATPLHMAVDVARRGTEGRPDLVRQRLATIQELLRLGADPKVASHDGETPLHTALRKEYVEVFELLLAHGADPDLPGKDGRTVREIAGRKRSAAYREAVERLAG